MPSTIIASQLAVDPALVMDANYKFNATQRRYIDDQIRAIEQHLVDNLINGRHATWFTLSGASVAVTAGDTVCLSGVPGLVTKSNATDLDSVLSALGVVIQAASPGGKVLVAISGVVPPSITGLGTTAGFVRIDTATSVCERVAGLSTGDFVIGTVDAAGYLHVMPSPKVGSTSGTVLTTSASLAAALSDETGTGLCVFNTSPTFKTTILLRNPADTFSYTFTPAAIVAGRTITLPLLAGNDTMVCEAFAATLTNKTIAGANNTLSVRIANDVTGLGAYVATFLATPSGANLGTALTSELPGTKVALAGAAQGAMSSGDKTKLDGIQAQGAAIDITGGSYGNNINWTSAGVFSITLAAGANALTFSSAASGMCIMVRVTGAASTLTWPTVKWPGGVVPTQTASGRDIYTFVHDGTDIYGTVSPDHS